MNMELKELKRGLTQKLQTREVRLKAKTVRAEIGSRPRKGANEGER